MKDKDILDSDIDSLFYNSENSYREMIVWWEEKRLTYNVILFFLQVSLLVYYSEEVVHFGVRDAIVSSILYSISANCFYTMGWAIEALLKFHDLNFKYPDDLKIAFWIVGMLFSVFLTTHWYGIVLRNAQPTK